MAKKNNDEDVLFFKIEPQGSIYIWHVNKYRIFIPVKEKYTAYIIFFIQVNTYFSLSFLHK